MTRDDFVAYSVAFGDPVIKMADGRMGMAPHHDDHCAIVDAYHGNECEQVHVPFDELVHIGACSMMQVSKRP